MALYRHTVSGTFPGETWSFGLHTTGTVTVTAAQVAWTAAFGQFWDAVDQTMATEVEVTETATADLDQATGKQITRVATPSALAGTSAAESLPFQCAPAVSLRSNLATRAGRGRFYAPSLAVDQIAGGKMVVAAQNALLAGTTAMIGSLTAAGLNAVLYSRTTHTTQEIVRADVGDVIDTQRRRRNKLIEQRVSANV